MNVEDVCVVTDLERGYVRRIFTVGHDANLAAWEEEVRELFDVIIEHFSDDPSRCKLRGEAKWVHFRLYTGRDGGSRIQWQLEPFEKEIAGSRYSKATMIRVHRNNTPRV